MTTTDENAGYWDLSVAVVWVSLSWFVVFVPGIRNSWIRFLVVLPTVLLWPGYGIIAAVFPKSISAYENIRNESLLSVERIGLSIAVSVAVGIGLGTVLLWLPIEFSPVTTLLTMSFIVIGGISVAWIRREPNERFFSEFKYHPAWLNFENLRPQTATWHLDGITVTMALLIAFATISGIGGIVYLGVIHEPTGYTEFAIFPPDTQGNLTYQDYQQALQANRGLEIRLTNHHSTTIQYKIVAVIQQAQITANGVQVDQSQTVATFTVTLAPNETWTKIHHPSIPWQTMKTRIVYRLYRIHDGTTKRITNTHIWANSSALQPAITVSGWRAV
ncbi:MAG: DUF1616 domain-containing protein [Halobacteriaceae archaeon]